MATLSRSSLVPQSAPNALEVESKSRLDTRAFRLDTLPSFCSRASSRYGISLKICRLSQSSKYDLFAGRHILSRKGQRMKGLPGSISTRCAYGSRGGSDDAMGGDPHIQQMLVEMVQIQMGNTRMSEFVDERSQIMRNIAQDTYDQYDRIAYRAMKGLDATGSRVLRQLDADAQAIERELRVARAELEAQEDDFEEYQQIVAYSRNEGLFFKNLYPAPKHLRFQSTALSKIPMKEKVAAVSPSRDFSSSYKQVLYGGLSLVIVSFIWSSSSAMLAGTWMRAPKLASYGIIFSALLTQLAYVKVLVGEEEDDPIDVASINITKCGDSEDPINVASIDVTKSGDSEDLQ